MVGRNLPAAQTRLAVQQPPTHFPTAMFASFAGVWTPLLHLREVGTAPRAVTLAGERLVVFRQPGADVAVLLDRCPHRGAALSLGRVTPQGCIECPFHGWQFDMRGRNCHVPFDPDAKLARLSAQALPTRVVGDLVWVYTDPAADAPAEPVVAEGLRAVRLTRTYVQRSWRCHWTRAMENMLDSPHLPFVHRRTIGKSMSRQMTPQSRLEVRWEATPWGGRTKAVLDGRDGGAFLEFYKPNVMALHIPVPGRHLRIHALVIPAEPGTTRLMICQSRDFARSRLLNPVFSWMNRRIADEDRAVVESIGSDEVPTAAEQASVATDRATLQFRKYYFESLRGSVSHPRSP